MLLPVRVTPRGGRNCILRYEPEDSAIKLKVSAPPDEGKANQAVIQLLADTLKLPKSRISIIRGDKSREKQVKVSIAGREEAEKALCHLAEVLEAKEVFHITTG